MFRCMLEVVFFAWISFFFAWSSFFLLEVVCVKSCFSYFWVCPVKNHSLSFELGPAKETYLFVLFLFLCNHLNLSFSVNISATFLQLSLSLSRYNSFPLLTFGGSEIWVKWPSHCLTTTPPHVWDFWWKY